MAHLTVEQRYTISIMLKSGYSQSAIAKTVNKDKSVISRELNRNSDARSGEYRSDLAQRKTISRHKAKRKKIRFSDAVKANVDTLIKDDHSPEQVAGTLNKQGKDYVSHERIYQYIWQDKKQKGSLHLHLRHQGRKYRKRGQQKDKRGIIKERVSIEERPEIVEKRERFGDLEVDLNIGKNHNQAMLTINDRASGILKMRKVPSKESKVISKVIVNELEDWSPYIKTITADNGKEFADHKYVAEQLGIDYYFARPYHSWERGSNENLNGLIRQYFKKSSDFTKITDEQVKAVEKN
jgi:IS30 family transposase